MGDAQAEQFDDTLLADFADKFYGYGTYNAPYWFIGMEEGGGSFEEVKRRLDAWRLRGQHAVEDLRSFTEAFGKGFDVVKFFHDPAVLQPTWNKLIRVVLSATDPSTTIKSVRKYQQEQLGITGGETCLLELLPLPSPSTKVWFYAEHSRLKQLATREQYKQYYMPLRAAHIA